MARGGEHGHVDADLGDDDLGGPLPHPGNGVEPVPLVGVGLHEDVDAGVEVGDGGLQGVEAAEEFGEQGGVVVGEPADQRSTQFGDLVAQAGLGHLGEDVGVADPGDERLDHGPARHPERVGGHRGELDPGVFEDLVHPQCFPGPFLNDPGAVAGEIPQLSDRAGGTKLARSRPYSSSSASHSASLMSVLRPGTRLRCAGLMSNSSKPASSSTHHTGFQKTPVDSMTTWVTPSAQPLRQGPQIVGERQVGAHLRTSGPPPTRGPHAGGERLLVHV